MVTDLQRNRGYYSFWSETEKKCVPEKSILADESVYISNPRIIVKLELNHNKDFISKLIHITVEVDFEKH